MSRSKQAGIAALATIAIAATSVAAQAADLPYATAPAAPVYSNLDVAIATDEWTGFYIGAHLGGATTHEFEEATSGLTGGVQAGYLQQFGNFVVGAEVQASLSDALYYELAPGAGLEQNWSVALKGRAGAALGQTLIYGTAGVTLAEFEPRGATTSASDTHAGLSFGAGIEQALGGGWSVRAEYLQTRYFDVDSAVGGIGRTDDLTNHAITAGVNFRF
jgi:outer membrane immunogenic protein